MADLNRSLQRIQSYIDSGRIPYDALDSKTRSMFNPPPTEDEKRAKAEAIQAQKESFNIKQAGETRNRRKIIDGVDPALANVETPILKRGIGSLGIGILEGASNLGKNYGAQVPDIMTGEKINVGFQVSPEDIATMEKGIGYKNTLPENIIRGFGEFVPAIALGGGLNKAAGLTKLAQESGSAYKGMIGNKTLGKGAEVVTKQLPDMLTTWGLMEGNKPEEERVPFAEWAAMWAGTELAMRGIGAGVKAGINKYKLGKGATKEKPVTDMVDDVIPDDPMEITLDEIDNLDDLFQPASKKTDFVVEPGGRTHIGEPQLELPAGRQPLALGARPQPLALSAGEQPLALRQGVDWEYKQPADFAVGPDGKAVAKDTVFPLAKVEGVDYTANTGLKGKQRIAQDIDQTIPRSDIGDPAYLAELKNKYNGIIKEEVARIKDELGGVAKYMPDEQNGPLLYASLNSKWYRDFWKKNGREPREGEYRDMAIKNLIEGTESDTIGTIPASDEFNQILSELSRGQKLPEEWHGLQQSMRELDNAKKSDAAMTDSVDNGLDSLMADMQKAQKEVEPYGLNRDIERLNEVENSIRDKARMVDKADLGEYENVRFKKQTPPEIQAQLDAATQETGWKKQYAPEAMKSERFQVANEISKALTGKEVITYTGNASEQGFSLNGRVFLNARSKQPTVYITAHEITHTMEVTNPEHYVKLRDIVIQHVKDDAKIIKHYLKQGYEDIDIPDELTADILAECMVQKTFWERVRDNAPELLKPILDTLDRILNIAQKQTEVPNKYKVMDYMKDVEVMRDRLAVVYQDYLKANKQERTFVDKFGSRWQETAAKAKGGRIEPVQKISSADTSLNQVAGTFKSRYFESGETNLDIGGGKYDKGTDYLAGRGINNQVYDPFNRDAAHNKAILDQLKSGQKHDSVTVNNVLNVIAEPEIRANVIKQAAKSVGEGKKAYFQIYEGNGKGIGRQTTKGWQNNAKAENYLEEVRQYFNNVERKGNLIIASEPKADLGKATWGIDNNPNSNIRFKSSANEQPQTPIQQIAGIVNDLAGKIPQGMTYEVFSKEITAQYPNMTKALPYIWQQAEKLATKGNAEIKYRGESLPLKITGESKPTGSMEDNNYNTAESISSYEDLKQKFNLPEFFKQAYRNIADNKRIFNDIDNEIKKSTGKGLSESEKLYIMATDSTSASGMAQRTLEKHMVDSQGNVIGDSFASVISKATDAVGGANNWRVFEDYNKLNHAMDWMKQGRDVYPEEAGLSEPVERIRKTLEEIEKIQKDKTLNKDQKATVIAQLQDGINTVASQIEQGFIRPRLARIEQQFPNITQAGREYGDWIAKFGEEWGVKTGLIKPEDWAALRQQYPNYIPLQRVMEEVEEGIMGTGAGFGNQSNPLKKGRGSERKTIESVEVMMERIPQYIKMAKKNEVGQNLVKYMEQFPEDMAESWGKIVKTVPGEPVHKNVVTVRVNGKEVSLELYNPALLEAMTGFNKEGQNKIVEAVRAGTSIMKTLTTGVNPLFSIGKNVFYDTPSAYAYSKTLSRIPGTPINNPVEFTVDLFDSLFRIITNEKWNKEKYLQMYRDMGGGTFASSSADRNLMAESKAKIMPGYIDFENKPIKSLGRGAKIGYEGLQKIMSVTETLPRLPEFKRVIQKQGNSYDSRLKGLYEANDITFNFSRHGDAVKWLDAGIPYLNAAVQGMDKFGRAFKDNPAALIANSLVAVTLLEAGLYALNYDNPAYQDLSEHEKARYYNFPVLPDDKFVKIVKPREIGVVFGTLVTDILDYMQTNDPKEFESFKVGLQNSFLPPDRTIYAPFSDIAKNKTFSGSPIVPGYMSNVSPEYQYDANTSAPAKYIAGTGIGKTLGLSPKKLDYLGKSYGGVLAQVGQPVTATGGDAKEVIKRQFVADPVYSNDTFTEFYEEVNKLNTADKNVKAGHADTNNDPNKRIYLNRVGDQISKMRKNMRAVEEDQTIDAEVKKEKLRKMQQDMVNLAKNALVKTK